MLKNIKNIIFDLGGVLINIAPERSFSAFSALGSIPTDEVKKLAHSHALVERHETGELTDADFRTLVNRLIDTNHDDETIDLAWNAMLMDIPTHRLELLKELKTKYRLFLLSNTNNIHYTAIRSYLIEFQGGLPLEAYFEKTYVSHLMGMRKPAREIYDYVLQDAGLVAEETLFIDDNAQNIAGASLTGIRTQHHIFGTEVVDLFS